MKTTSKEKGLEEAYEKLKDGLGLVTYEVSKGTHTHNHPILGEMSMEKDCLDLVQLFLYKKCIKKVFMASAVIISKSDTSYKVQIPNRDIHKCFEDAEVINIKNINRCIQYVFSIMLKNLKSDEVISMISKKML